jgi:TatA/E family protein of Tat protein translocase
MFSVPHLVVLFIVVLVFFGPHKLPELARGLGKLMAEFRKASNDFKMAFEEEMRSIERQNREAEWKKSQEESDAKRQKELASSSTAEEINSEDQALSAEKVGTATGETIDPVVAPVNESVAREREADGLATASESASAQVPSEEATSSDASSDAKSAIGEDRPAQPNDQRQPA